MEKNKIKICPYSKTLPKMGKNCKSNCWAYAYDDCLAELEKDIALYNDMDII